MGDLHFCMPAAMSPTIGLRGIPFLLSFFLCPGGGTCVESLLFTAILLALDGTSATTGCTVVGDPCTAANDDCKAGACTGPLLFGTGGWWPGPVEVPESFMSAAVVDACVDGTRRAVAGLGTLPLVY